jgi:hypothetical protein
LGYNPHENILQNNSLKKIWIVSNIINEKLIIVE